MLTKRSNIIDKSSLQALELIGYFSDVVVLLQLLLRNKRKLLNGRLIRQTTIPVVKRLVRGRWSTTLKVGGGNSLHYIFMQG